MFGSEIEAFFPCDVPDKGWWTISDQAIWIDLRDAYLELADAPGEGVYVKLTGHDMGPPNEEKSGVYSLNFDGVFKIEKVWFVRKRDDTDCGKSVGPSN